MGNPLDLICIHPRNLAARSFTVINFNLANASR
jgi:hypothetical protein